MNKNSRLGLWLVIPAWALAFAGKDCPDMRRHGYDYRIPEA